MNVRVYKPVEPREDRKAWIVYAAEKRFHHIRSGGPDVPVFRFALPQDRSRSVPYTHGEVPGPNTVAVGELTFRADQVELYRGEWEHLCHVRVKDDEFYYGTKTGRFYERDHDAERRVAQNGGAA